jgi:cathepsin L
MANNKSYDLSEQQIVDCSSAQGNNGCNGGWMTNVFSFAVNYGITYESLYPYNQVIQSCKKSTG